MTFVFHACGSQLLSFEMPGSKRVLTDSFIARRMHDNDLTEEQLFAYREDELPHIQAGTVMLIPEVEKERVLDLLQETLRLRIELGSLVSMVRGDPYLRSMSARGDDFLYVSVQPVQHLSTAPIAFLLQRLSKHLESKYSIDIPPAELRFEITGGERIPNGYTLLDLVFVAATSAIQERPFRRHVQNTAYHIGSKTNFGSAGSFWSEPLADCFVAHDLIVSI